METTYFVEPNYPLWDKVKKAIRFYGNLTLALLFTFLVLRFLEMATLSLTRTSPSNWWVLIAATLYSDSVVYLKLAAVLAVPSIISFLLFRYKRNTYLLLGVLGSILIVFYVVLIHYFSSALVPLGADLYAYSMAEIMQTIHASGDFSIVNLFMVFFPVAIYWIVLYALYLRPILGFYPGLILVSVGAIFLYFGIAVAPKNSWFKNEYEYNLSLNKLGYFLEHSATYFFEKSTNFSTISTESAHQFTYINSAYPFLHTENTPDVLGPFFSTDASQMPNIMIIQVEGLGRAFSGKGAYLGSFTPFLDSLASQSLYWENFLSAQGRTFAVLPSILGSLPFAKTGFNDLGDKMPKQLSLMRVLSKAGYRTSFIAGTDLDFDHQCEFLKRQGSNELIGAQNYSSKYHKMASTSTGDSWGYPDREIYRRALDGTLIGQKAPFLCYLQTISMHSPYQVPNQQAYVYLLEERFKQLGMSNAEKAEHRQYQNVYSTILYADEALEDFFAAAKKSSWFAHTIFIITGDHRLPEIPISTKIDRFHVPLIIYSPLLRKTAQIASISSHLDIAPSVLAFLAKNYGIKRPDVATWLGNGLDTVRSFRNIHQYPLKQVKSELRNYISGLYFLDGEQVFKISPSLDIEPIDDTAKQQELLGGLAAYKRRNEQFIKHKQLVPDSVLAKF
ncbi:MAG: LTA synthase family protein [Sphingobacteriaceae bacterium]